MKNSPYPLTVFQGTVEGDQDGAVRLSDFWRPSVLSDIPDIEVSKASGMHTFGILAWEVANPLLSSNRSLKNAL